MSGGPQVFLGATTFCLIASPSDFRQPRVLCGAWLRRGWRPVGPARV